MTTIDRRTPVGHVWLVGAGPGDPDLLTVKAQRCLAEADVVFYDALVAPEIVALAASAQRFSVGKRAGRAPIGQSAIQRLLIRTARRGRRVVRLKGGDPFVFGRGGEEALALGAAGVPFEVVPGLTAAVTAPALADIPVTHRGAASGFVVLTGHDDAASDTLLARMAPGSLTLVVLMGLRRRRQLASRLKRHGWPAATPVAIICDAGTRHADVWRGTLDRLAREPLDLPANAAGTIVVGDVVTVGARIAAARPHTSPSAAGGRSAVR